ncbi:MAG TPA: hypothetical protein VGB49_00335, partial [Caulobacteraceae bacterium]
MTETPPPDTPETNAPGEVTGPDGHRPGRTRRALIRLLVVCGVIIVLVLLMVGAVGRLGVLSPAGRDLVTSFVEGKKLGRYGRIRVEGVSGDLWDDFTIRRVTVTDAKGVWLEAHDVRVDWSYLPLMARRFHADEVTARQIRVLRRPEIEPPDGKPPRPLPLGIDIDRFAAQVELLEGFSQEYGRWTLEGEADIARIGEKTGRVNALSLSRQGDRARATFAFGGARGPRLDLEAFEQQGGPIAGALGFSPDQPFIAIAKLDERVLDANVRSGRFTPIQVQGRFDERGGTVAGRFVFAGSDLLQPFADRLGVNARFGMAAVRDRGDVYGVGWTLLADNLTARARGRLNWKTRTVPDAMAVELATPSVTRLAGVTIASAGSYRGTWRGTPQRWTLDGATDLRDALVAGYTVGRATGPLKITAAGGRFDFDADLRGEDGRGEGMLAALLGSRLDAKVSAARLADGRWLVESFDGTARALRVRGSGSRAI